MSNLDQGLTAEDLAVLCFRTDRLPYLPVSVAVKAILDTPLNGVRDSLVMEMFERRKRDLYTRYDYTETRAAITLYRASA